MNVTEHRTQKILQALHDKHDLKSCSHYGEPGYHDPAASILFADWNPISKRIGDYLEEAGFELEWSDEWYIDYNNDKAWRTSPDSYGWVRQIVYTDDGEVLTPDNGAAEIIEALAMSDRAHPCHAVPNWVTEADIEAAGYTAIGGVYETGWYPGQNNNPSEIAKGAFANGAGSVVFRIKSVGQFDIHFQGFAKGIS